MQQKDSRNECCIRCQFIIFMPNKPDKFGVKFWMLAEVKTKYIVAIIPYLGKEDNGIERVRSLSEEVVLNLLESVKNKGYNLTMDNYFTSLSLAAQLKALGTSLTGTMRENRKELPKDFLKSDKQALYRSSFFINEPTGALLCKYNCKKNKTVAILSTMHNKPDVDMNSEKRKPEVIHFYNKHKVGVDTVDSMARFYSTRCSTRRWPVAVWCNVLDLVGINSWIIFKDSTGRNISRQYFLFELVDQLREKYVSGRSIQLAPSITGIEKQYGEFLNTCRLSTFLNRSLLLFLLFRSYAYALSFLRL